MRADEFDYELPPERIALRPCRPRDAARLLCVEPERNPPITDRVVSELADVLSPGDALVINDTRVIRAALTGVRVRQGVEARIAVTLLKPLDANRWQALARPAKRLKSGDRIDFGADGRVCLQGTLSATVEERRGEGEVILAFDFHGAVLEDAIGTVGEMPLPPYISSRRPADERDEKDYQTVFAARDGAVAAPTAGLHFTQPLFDVLSARGISHHFVTLHVGAGTFLPMKAADTQDHKMHAEWGEVHGDIADALNAVRAQGGRLVAIGTTALRLLESAADESGSIRPFAGETSLFITPGYRFRAVDRLFTNFHLPRSTLFMLVSAFSGLDVMKRAYAHAIEQNYRFYSYGDACLLSPKAETL